jgi:hypothetical protein
MIKNLGKVVGILARAEADEHFAYEDLSAFHAPSECYPIVAKGLAKKNRRARKLAEAIAQAPLRVILKQAARRGAVHPNSPRWGNMVGRVYSNMMMGA